MNGLSVSWLGVVGSLPIMEYSQEKGRSRERREIVAEAGHGRGIKLIPT
jgi:hypothetical protein